MGRGCVALDRRKGTYNDISQIVAKSCCNDQQTIYIYIYFNIFIYIFDTHALYIYNIHMPVFEFQILKVDHQHTQQNPPLTMEEMLSCQIFGQEMLGLRHELIRSFSKRPSKRLSQRSSTAIVICMFLVDGSNMF